MTTSEPEPQLYRVHIEEHEIEGMRLGRHVLHDPRSREYEAEQAVSLRTVTHGRIGPVFDQGNIGSCTGNAAGGLLMTAPFYKPGRVVDETFCVMIYEMATRLDSFGGSYPPNDTGSSGLAAAKTLKNAGQIGGYSHTFDFQSALRALTLKPGMVGLNWYDSFDHPGPDGMITITPNADVRGGHELEVNSLNVEQKWVGGPNSWGPLWGAKGWWRMSWSDFERVLFEDGDFTFPS